MSKRSFKESAKAVFDRVKAPKPWVFVMFLILTLLMLSASIVLLVLGFTQFWVYIINALTAILLAYTIYLIVHFYPLIKAKVIETLKKSKSIARYLEDYKYKSLVNTCITFSINIAYALTQGVLAILSNSIWYGTLAAYYIILCFIRGGIVYKHFKRRKVGDEKEYALKQAQSYRNCGIYLNILTFALSGSIVQMVILNQGYRYAGIMIYVMALYTFYKLALAIKNIVKAWKRNDFTIMSIRDLNLSDALVSMLALQTAMFQAFGEGSNPYIFNAITGAGVTLILIALSVVMIAHGNREIKRLKLTNNNNKRG